MGGHNWATIDPNPPRRRWFFLERVVGRVKNEDRVPKVMRQSQQAGQATRGFRAQALNNPLNPRSTNPNNSDLKA